MTQFWNCYLECQYTSDSKKAKENERNAEKLIILFTIYLQIKS